MGFNLSLSSSGRGEAPTVRGSADTTPEDSGCVMSLCVRNKEISTCCDRSSGTASARDDAQQVLDCVVDAIFARRPAAITQALDNIFKHPRVLEAHPAPACVAVTDADSVLLGHAHRCAFMIVRTDGSVYVHDCGLDSCVCTIPRGTSDALVIVGNSSLLDAPAEVLARTALSCIIQGAPMSSVARAIADTANAYSPRRARCTATLLCHPMDIAVAADSGARLAAFVPGPSAHALPAAKHRACADEHARWAATVTPAPAALTSPTLPALPAPAMHVCYDLRAAPAAVMVPKTALACPSAATPRSAAQHACVSPLTVVSATTTSSSAWSPFASPRAAHSPAPLRARRGGRVMRWGLCGVALAAGVVLACVAKAPLGRARR